MTTSVRTSVLNGYLVLMRQLGADPAEMLRRYRIAPESLADEEALLSLRNVTQLLEASAEVTACSDFGLCLSNQQDITVLGPLAIAMQNASTVGEALGYASRYLFVQSPGLSFSVHDSSVLAHDSVELRVEIHLAQQPKQRQIVDLCLADLHHMLQLLADRHYLLRAVTLPHSALAPLRTYRHFFAAPVRAEQEYAGLHIARSTLDASLPAGNRSLRQIALEYLALQFGQAEQTLATRVKQTLRRTLVTRRVSKSAIADLLGMHPRTLQRHLAAENTSFETIREELRKETALRYLCETRIPLTQLAGILGLSEQSALGRSCLRWFGLSPAQLRKRAHPGAGMARRPEPTDQP